MGDVVLRDADRPGDLGWVVMAHGELYAREYGWSVEAVTARIVADFAAGPAHDRAWIAELDRRRVGCVFCVHEDASTARLRLLLLDPVARGLGVGRALVRRCVAHARDAEYGRLVLWTNAPLDAARTIYLAEGFRLVAEAEHDEFGVALLGQDYELVLTA
ncbi:GNAT family N-acetyltransferase [Actinomycetospora sp. Odt1-22]|uniref:GNAT family N-acetyltransferase n=2 Tax=Actinomycetospora termitidis TaxID=3053470 RepID=A0ABT7M872_9PSEU|nr:GNAT family N-acetyltransferase [Actinomycetospora sp. Odt1-22]MDL5156880.1 GNAT family N-acetyltransferase [Actinomycetospora sp. Odt1-22]